MVRTIIEGICFVFLMASIIFLMVGLSAGNAAELDPSMRCYSVNHNMYDNRTFIFRCESEEVICMVLIRSGVQQGQGGISCKFKEN